MKEKNTVKEKVKSVNEEVCELTDDELAKVSGGMYGDGTYTDGNYAFTYTDDNSGGINRNPGDKYFGDR